MLHLNRIKKEEQYSNCTYKFMFHLEIDAEKLN